MSSSHAGDSATSTMPDPGHRQLHLQQSVRVRITLAAVVVTTAAVGFASWLLVRSVEDTQIGHLRDEINAQLDEVSSRLEVGDDPVLTVQGPPSSPLVQVVNEHGRTVAAGPTFQRDGQTVAIRFREDGEDGVLAEPTDTDRYAHSEGTVIRPLPPPSGATTDPGDGRELRAQALLITPDYVFASSLETLTRTVDTPTGTVTVSAAAPVEPVTRSVAALRRALVVGLPALVILVAAIAWTLVGRALRPVEAIRAEVDEITGTTMHRRVPEPPTGDEIGRLARTMNAMLGRLDRTATRQRQFVSDASHELRSPVAAIRTGLEVARRNPERANWPAVADTALAEESRLEALLDDLLLLAAQDENGDAASKRTPVDLAGVTAAEAERPRRVPVRITHGSDDPEEPLVPGDADQLARVVSNLLDNAARYATSAVRVSLSRLDDTVRLTVDDDGPGIPDADRERVFERFTRLDDSRARDNGGSGLGLAVVRSIVTRHHGQVWAEDGPLGGARFVVDLPT